MTLPLKKVYKPHPLVNKLSRHILARCGECCDIPRSVDTGLGALLFLFAGRGQTCKPLRRGIKSKLLRRKENENEADS